VKSIKPVAISIVIILILVSAFILFSKPQTPKTQYQTLTSTQKDEKVNPPAGGKASFTIVTGTITRSFRDEKYHNQSPDVYIESVNPAIVHVKKTGITWDDFFKTLPHEID
jgi:hypothetical protein